MSEEKPKGSVTHIPGNGEVIIKGSVVKPAPSTPQDSVSPPPSAIPSKDANNSPQASK